MSAVAQQRIGSVASGDVDLFYRWFGERGATPLLILHGANYYDSSDWVPIAGELAGDRQVCTYDARGYGRSTWSLSHDYSLDAQLLDMRTLLARLGWEQAVLVGHSRGGSFALRFAHAFPAHVAGVVLVDFSPGHVPGRARVAPLGIGSAGAIYASLEAAHAATSRDPRELDSAAGRARVDRIFARREGGWVNVSRDPKFQNERPNDQPRWASAFAPIDLWDALAGVVARGVPSLVVRGTRSGVYDEAALARLRDDFPAVGVVEVESGHDVPGAAPAALSAAMRDFLTEGAA